MPATEPCAATVLVTLHLHRDDEPISGWWSQDDQPPRAFSGWLELAAALKAVRCPEEGSPRNVPDRPARSLHA